MSCPVHRKYPLRQPKNYKPPVPRWQLHLPPGIDRVYTIYVGVQQHACDAATQAVASKAKDSIAYWITTAAQPSAYETFSFVEGDDEPRSDIWVCYFTDRAAYEQSACDLSLRTLHASLDTSGAGANKNVGLWCERFSTAASRLETNYSGLDYLPGLARIPDTAAVEHTYSAYWGAARDRIPDSAHDLFPRPPSSPSSDDDGNGDQREQTTTTTTIPPSGRGQRLVGTNYENMVHIRSGQFWKGCDEGEARAYEDVLEPALMTGLRYLWANAADTGTVGLRFVRNAGGDGDDDGRARQETCAAGFFRSLGDLENWAERHPSHKAIYLGAIKHAKTFGPERKMRTWHEVSVLKAGEAQFEYVNCTPKTGVIGSVGLHVEEL
ncbi:phenylacetaldoxime dehydratase family [Diplodia corticola]|uniref:Phenylacetaldoxime dehydratase family n=1 Tax=Diplodia corticola TaxID=236234 RepID=A0A1J9R578_9PEZI|nr:phenylacetaldoxime dehydratase family [Diplodia corticola]OJD35705.1 phenylacetaldoxime dehydratase family [Diplodia corticola]